MFFLYFSLVFLSACGSESVGSRTGARCSRDFNVDTQKSGIIYEYIRGDEAMCSYHFRSKEGQKIMLSINHIGLLPRHSNEECVPKIIKTDLLFTGEERSKVTFCNADDVTARGSFVSVAKSSKIVYYGPSDSDGILLIHYWFVNDVTLIPPPRPTGPPPANVIEDFEDGFVTLKCDDWGANLDIESCSCVEYATGNPTNYEPPFCLIPTKTLETKCLKEVSEIQHELATQMIFTNHGRLPPSCDDEGNFEKLQCDGDSRRPCKCVDPVSGEDTYLMPPDCEYPYTTAMPLMTTMEITSVKTCSISPCKEFCPFGQEMDEAGCPMCDCKEAMTSTTSETCYESKTHMENEITQWKELEVKSGPYPWLPQCADDGSYREKQCNYLAGCFCVDTLTGVPNGKKHSDCVTYKDCVTKRITALFRVLRDGGYRKTGKLVRGLLTGNDANNMNIIMEMLSEEEYNSILSNSDTHIPSCNAYGDYEAVQCRPAEGTCWCVDLQGDAIAGSESSSVYPDCSMYSRQGDSWMPVSTDTKQELTTPLINIFIFYCEFKNISESDDMYIFWTQNGIPIASFNEYRYTEGDAFYSSYQTATSWLKIDSIVEEDVGSYGCEIADTSRDYFYKAELQTLSVWTRNAQSCIIQDCDKYCGMGHRNDEHGCRTCECFQKEEVLWVGGIYQIQRQIFQSFGAHNGRCEAKRQLIKRQLQELDFSDPYLEVSVELLPQCDADGNYELLQNMKYFGRICVDKMSGQVSGRTAPDCDEWTKCIDQTTDTTTQHIAFFTNQSTADEVKRAANQARTFGERVSIIDQSFLTHVPTEYTGDRTGLPPIIRCDTNTGLFYLSLPVCSETSPTECWCIDENGDELDETRAAVGESMLWCRDYVPASPGPRLVNIDAEEVTVTVGDTLTLNCDVTASSPDNYIMWETRSRATLEQTMVMDDRFEKAGDEITDFALRITNIQEEDAGLYTCNLYNYQSMNDQKEYSVIVEQVSIDG
ncbi:uncharacterized protein [Antedon mediterranea]|uniref:uncharacterized protein n=1 Tax=Antedon mediterranea TaxID=105859 RepID=UPI003AF8ADF9